ncbi:EspG family protein [Streptoalloteichus tenebrarius]|uniref:EspG family protein n=1 Tax=Streptoalloteichus tenebrarius (strain ATCC 17920 / DSM 40477 / JCM 4838 / CBS 697.72 / NBRC 16177 / NCIMB 11028 / NRRL B-12390 / A12253. 1 / ISP 5477) TaxID=1933 RepID=A0ABT1I135_STRSD|nr:ESX secretion-associated protein EspG [Streptoalloteichus tenebrarius]MCP2261493.1 EspG family protein [Streptoalloteichus tenebrarius]BFE99349.1 ESX secretion-associated protein EspG [Streptoalloteichus tenebrarius]
MADHDFTLTTRAWDILWRDRELGPMPYPVDAPSVGRTVAERATLREEVHADLADQGLMSRGRLDVDLDELMRALATADLFVDAVGHVGWPLRAVAASTGATAVLAVLDGDRVGLSAIRPTGLAGAVVDLVPDRPAGPGAAMTVPLAALARAVGEDVDPDDPFADPDEDERQALVRAGVPAARAEELLDLAAARTGGGQVGVSRVGPHGGGARRHGPLVSWFDTDRGRYLAVPDGDWLSIAPIDNARLAARVDDLLVGARG